MSSLRPVSGTAEEILGLLRAWDAAAEPEPLVVATSGSTGRPKRVLLARDAMRASALATQERLGGPGQWVLNLPPSYVAGVQVLYRSVVAGTEPVVAGREDDLAGVLARMEHGRRYVSLVPTQLVRSLAAPGEADALAGFDAVLIGGGPLRPTARDLAEANGIRVVQTYGMSETCGGCVYDGVPLAGVEVGFDPGGQVLLRGPMLFEGYQDEPERTAAAFHDGWLLTNDLGHLEDDGRLRIDGRADEVIISGGVKVPPHAVERLLGMRLEHDLAVVGVPDEEWGERVVLVVASEHPPSLADVRDLVEPRSWAPRQLVAVAALPLLANGKVDRVRLRELA